MRSRPRVSSISTAPASRCDVDAQVAALDHIKDGARINAVSPGATDSSMSLRPGETIVARADRLADTVPLAALAPPPK